MKNKERQIMRVIKFPCNDIVYIYMYIYLCVLYTFLNLYFNF